MDTKREPECERHKVSEEAYVTLTASAQMRMGMMI
jgi:hypothetical protein